jgi:hypothetical protein
MKALADNPQFLPANGMNRGGFGNALAVTGAILVESLPLRYA